MFRKKTATYVFCTLKLKCKLFYTESFLLISVFENVVYVLPKSIKISYLRVAGKYSSRNHDVEKIWSKMFATIWALISCLYSRTVDCFALQMTRPPSR